LPGLCSRENRIGGSSFAADRADGDVGASGGRAAVPRITAGAFAAFADVHVARVALEGIFLVGCGGIVTSGGAYRICRGILCGGQPLWGGGATGNQLSRL